MATIASGVATGVAIGGTYATLTDLLRSGVTWAKWKAVGSKFAYPLIADVLQKILDADKDEVHGLSTKGMVDTIYSFIDRTIDFSVLLNEQIASQLFIQMIQQSIAYAIHSAHAGSIGSVVNVYSGSQSLSGLRATEVGATADLVDRGTKGFISASMGLNVPSLTFETTRGINVRIGEVYQRIVGQVDSILDEWNDLALSYYRHYHSMATNRLQDALEMEEHIVTRGYGFLEQVANEHLARINEQLDTLEGAKAWFDAGYLTKDELKQIALRIGLEEEASEDNFDDYKDEVLEGISGSLGDWNTRLEHAVSDMKTCEAHYAVLFNKIFLTLFGDVRIFVQSICDEADKTIEDVCAYRNIKQSVHIDVVNAVGETEASPETEIYRLRYGKWVSIPWRTVIYPYSKARGLPWQTDEEHDMGIIRVERATVITRRRWVEVDEDIVVHETQPTPLVPWESAD